MNTHVTFVTDAFEMETPKENFINPDCFGEDCAIWLADKLKEKDLAVDKTFQEDWGWCFFVTINDYKFWIGVGLIDGEKTWLVFAESGLGRIKKLFGKTDKLEHQQLCTAIDEVLTSTSHLSEVKWFSKEGFMKGSDQ